MLNAETILLPYDFSSAADRAVPYALDVAARAGATLHVFCAEVLYGQPSFPARVPSARHLTTRERLQQTLCEHARHAEADVAITCASERDISADAAILRYAAAQHADLIVMGTHGRNGLQHFMRGSVTKDIVRNASAPVLTVNERAGRAGRPEATGLRRLLVPTDFSDRSRAALRYAKALAARFDAEIDLFHAVEETLHPAFYGPAVQSIYDAQPHIEDEVTDRLAALHRTTEGGDGRVTLTARPGPVTPAIAERARETGADLIVMATRGRTGLARAAKGSVTEQVLRAAPCPVLTSRQFETAPARGLHEAAHASASVLAA